MLATLIDKPFDDQGWSYEIKWDGYRALAYLQKGKVTLRSRNNKSFEKYYPIYDAFQQWPVNAVIDGEIVVLNEKGQSDFGDAAELAQRSRRLPRLLCLRPPLARRPRPHRPATLRTTRPPAIHRTRRRRSSATAKALRPAARSSSQKPSNWASKASWPNEPIASILRRPLPRLAEDQDRQPPGGRHRRLHPQRG